MAQPLRDLISPDWAEALSPVEDRLQSMLGFLQTESTAGRSCLPSSSQILNAFARPFRDVSVLIVGQDPYPTPGHAMGLAFSVERDTRPLPRSLGNIYKELETDLGIAPAKHGDLSGWADQGVMLLNRVLSVRSGNAGSHRNQGWEQITEHAIKALVTRNTPLVTVLWGRDAQSLVPWLGDTARVMSAHPSPLSASRGFFGSKPFSTVNAMLQTQGASVIDWRVS